MTKQRSLISVLIPIYNEEANIQAAYEAVTSQVEKLEPPCDLEVVFTDNHSTDSSFEILKSLAETDSRVKVIRFSKNFGYQRSLLTAYLAASGDAAIQLDCDLQDPVELIPDFVERWRADYAVVYGVRRSRQEGMLIGWIRKLFTD